MLSPPLKIGACQIPRYTPLPTGFTAANLVALDQTVRASVWVPKNFGALLGRSLRMEACLTS